MSILISALPAASTIDGALDVFPIVTNNINTTQKISRNTFLGLASAPVGLTDSQTLTNKILTSPTINTPTVSSPTFSGTIAGTYTIGGTPTFPAAVVTLTGSQTLTNKVLTAPTITNATISADTLAGFTVSTNGTIYGMSVTGGVIASAALNNAVNTAAIQGQAVTAAKMINGMVAQRQGGTTGDASWQTAGTSNTNTSAKNAFVQAGVGNIAGAETVVTFPVAFNQVPIVVGAPNTATGFNTSFRCRLVSTTGFTASLIENSTAATQAPNENFGWIAIGQ